MIAEDAMSRTVLVTSLDCDQSPRSTPTAPDPSSLPPAIHGLSEPRPSRQVKRVLFVDDQPELLSGLRRLFHSAGTDWEMRFASGGPEALQILSQWPADVIVSDMSMPGMNGADLLTCVMQSHPSVIRIMLSGQAVNEAIVKSIRSVHQYLSKPCPPEQLKAVITRVCSFRDRVNDPQLTRFVSTLGSLPSVPRIYTQLVEELKSPESTVSSVGQLMASDPAMSCRLLQIINSAFFGLPRRVESPAHAARLLGLERLRPLVLSAGIFSQYSGRSVGGLTIDSIMEHSLASAATVKRLIELESPNRVEMAQDAGVACIVHDIGQLILMENHATEYARLVQLARSGEKSLHELELSTFHVCHSAIGGYLLDLWGLPAGVTEAVTFHHTPRESHESQFGLVAAVHIATTLNHEWRAGSGHSSSPSLDMEFLRRLDLEDRVPVWREQLRAAERR